MIVSFESLSHFTPKQQEALDESFSSKYLLYGGSMGSGKSYFLRWAVVWWLLYLAKKYKKVGIRAGLFCEDYGALNDRHISKIKFEFPKGLGTYNEQKHEFHISRRMGGGVIAFRNLDDPSKYVSSEFAVIAVDEISRDPFSMFSILRTRLRWVGIPQVRFLCASNPLGEPWVKRFWVDRNFPPEEKECDEFKFVKALPTDNIHLDPAYFQSLESLDDKERKAFLEGDWNAFEEDMDEEGWMKVFTDKQLQDTFVEAKDANHFGDGVLGVDPAAGGDRSAIVYKSEMCKEVVFSRKLNDVLQMIPIIADAMTKYGNVRQIVVDRTGVGEGLFQRLRELKFPVKGISFASAPTDKERFDNYKAELYWKEREWVLKNGGKYVRNNAWMDWLNIKYKVYNGKVIKIQSKDELRRQGFKSPDIVDAAVLTNASSSNLRFNQIYQPSQFRDNIRELWRNL